VFGELGELREISWHNPSCSEYVIMLKGSIEIEVGNGTKKIFNEGDIILAEDTTGQGHVTRAASEGVRRYLIMPLKKN
jgi:quercetin dioxygenase-like cupin family protein